MSFATAVLTLTLLAVVMAVVSRPLLLARTHEGTPSEAQAGKPEEPDAQKRSELEAEREAKYREIRDAELDYRTGKLSREDYEAVNGALRAEALEILNKLEPSEGERPAGAERAGVDELPVGRQWARAGEPAGVDELPVGRQWAGAGEPAGGDEPAGKDDRAAEEDRATDPAK